MPRRTDPAQLSRFLGILEVTGNITLAAQRCGLAKSGIFKRRARDPHFGAAVDQALAAAKAGLPAETRAAATTSGKETTEPGDLIVCFSRRGYSQLRRVPPGRLTNAGVSAFLARLAATANVRLAAESVGVASSSIYARARTDSHFREAMQQAAAAGAYKIEVAMLEAALRGLDPEDAGEAGAEPLPPVTFGEALHLLRSHHPSRRRRRPAAPNSRAEQFRR